MLSFLLPLAYRRSNVTSKNSLYQCQTDTTYNTLEANYYYHIFCLLILHSACSFYLLFFSVVSWFWTKLESRISPNHSTKLLKIGFPSLKNELNKILLKNSPGFVNINQWHHPMVPGYPFNRVLWPPEQSQNIFQHSFLFKSMIWSCEMIKHYIVNFNTIYFLYFISNLIELIESRLRHPA